MEMSEEALMKAATFDRMETIYSPNGGHIVVVAVSHGVIVCWQCGEPFDEHDRRFRLVELKNDIDTSVPVGVHAQCFAGPKRVFSIGTELRKVAAGMKAKLEAIRANAYADRIAKVAKENAKKIVL